MKTLYFDCTMGAAGDMLMAALLELHPEPDTFISKLNSIGIPHVHVEKTLIKKCGIQATGINVAIHGHEEDEHMHDHLHRGMCEISHIVKGLDLPEKIRNDILCVYNLIAEAESIVHGEPVEHIHFHEIGSMDALADIAGVCMLIAELEPDKIFASPIHVGSGQIKCAHGILPVPAPATARILKGVPTFGGAVAGELCTPTGAALLKYFVHEFIKENSLTVENIGYGTGKRHFYDKSGTEVLSAVRAMIGEDSLSDEVTILSCNIDDMTGEQLGYACEILLDSGALEAYTTAVCTKKNRPGILLTVICANADKSRLAELIFRHTSTIGIRSQTVGRYKLERTIEAVSTAYGQVRVKKSSGYGVTKEKIEYEDLKRIALEHNISVSEANEIILKEIVESTELSG